MNDKNVKTSELFSCDTFYLTEFFARHEYPWEMLPEIGELAAKLIENPPKGFSLLAPGILVGEGVTIHESAVLEAPVILGEGCTVRPGAYLRGNVIAGKGCVIGNSTEVKNAILLDFAQVPHYNYVGDSILGNRAHTGAGAVCSNLKADGLPVVVRGKNRIQNGAAQVRRNPRRPRRHRLRVRAESRHRYRQKHKRLSADIRARGHSVKLHCKRRFKYC